MKKIVCAVFLAVVLGGIGNLPAMSVSRNTDETLIPYQNVITRLNHELGLNMYIFDKQKLHNSVENKTPAEFEATLRAEAKTADPNYKEPSQSEDFQTSHGAKAESYNHSSGMGKPSGAIPLPNAQGILSITPLK